MDRYQPGARLATMPGFPMPAGKPPEAVRAAAAEAARGLLDDHEYVFVMQEDQALQMHRSVLADRYDGVRLSA